MDQQTNLLANLFNLQRIQLLEQLRQNPKYDSPKHLIPHGYKMYSQSDEDGIISEIFNRIGRTNKTFVEFGIGTGLENNTAALLLQGWRGLWIDAADKHVLQIQNSLAPLILEKRLTMINSFITRENIDQLIASCGFPQEIDLLSVDIDGNDFHVLNAIKCIKPRVIVMEYNAKFPPPVEFCMQYYEQHVWGRDDHFGVSLEFITQGLRNKGYALVGCNLSGANAFFVREDLIEDKFLQPFNAAFHYEPARYYLASIPSGHAACFQTLLNESPTLQNSKQLFNTTTLKTMRDKKPKAIVI